MLLNYLLSSVTGYFYTLLHLFDPISDSQTAAHNQKQKSYKQSTFLGPALFLLLLQLIGIFGLHMDGYRTLVVQLSALPTSPYVFTHQAFPREVWPQMEAFMSISLNGGIVAAVLLASKWATPMLSDAYRLVAQEVECGGGEEGGGKGGIKFLQNRNGKLKSSKLLTGRRYQLISKPVQGQLHRSWQVGERCSALILAYRSAVHKTFYTTHAVFVAELCTQYIMVYMNGAFQWSVISVLFWAFIFPASIFHGIFMFYGVPIIMTIFVIVILVQQREAIRTMRQLNSQLSGLETREGSSAEFRRQRLLVEKLKNEYGKVNRATVKLNEAIAAYSRQWTAYLSTALPVQTVGVAYVAYVFFFGSRLPLTIRNLFAVADSALVLTIFTQLNLCAQVVRYSGVYVRQTELFVRGLSLLRKLSPAEQLKLVQSTTQEKREFAFRFLDDNTLNPSTFPMIFSYCTICILMIAKEETIETVE